MTRSRPTVCITLSPEARELLAELATRWRSSRSRAIERAIEAAWVALPADPPALKQRRAQAKPTPAPGQER